MPPVGTLILLVGSNPLPNYLAAATLRPKRVLLLYTPKTVEPMKRLEETLRGKLAVSQVDVREIADGTRADDVRDKCKCLPEGAHLNYTGGTKIMAAHARMAFRDQNGADADASYIDERSGVLRTDDASSPVLPLATSSLDLDVILSLHGSSRAGFAAARLQAPTPEDVDAVAHAYIEDPSIARKLFNAFSDENGHKRTAKDLRTSPFNPSTLNLTLSQNVIPASGWSTKQIERWRDFFRGGWLELWVAEKIHGLVGSASVSVGVDLTRYGRKLEVDILVIRGHRLYLASCTTDGTMGLCKSKLFEAALRARQIGGDLARCALVCMLEGADTVGTFASQLQSDVNNVWDAPNTPQLFALADLQAWAGIGQVVNLDSLKQWLDS